MFIDISARNVLDRTHMLKLFSAILNIKDNSKIVARILE